MRSKLFFLLLLTLCFASGCLAFFIMQPKFSSHGLDISISFYRIGVVVFVLLIAFVVFAKMKEGVLIRIYGIQMIALMTPMSILYVMSGESAYFYAAVMLATISMFWISDFIPKAKLPRYYFGDGRMLLIIIITPVLVLFMEMIRLGGVGYFNLNFMTVYDYRFQLREVYDSALYRYLFGWVKGVFLPALVIYSCVMRTRFLLAISIVLSILLFGFSSHKSASLVALFACFLFFFYRKIVIWYSVAVLLGLLGYLSMMGYPKQLLEGLFVHRLFFIPSILGYAYFDFFSAGGYVYFSDKLLSGVFDYTYSLPLPRLIGLHLFGREEVVANAGMFPLGYAHLGYFGIFIYSVIFVGIAWLIKSIRVDDNDSRLIFCLNFYPIYQLFLSSDLPTTLLTGGLFISIPLSFVFCRSKSFKVRMERQFCQN